MKEHKFYEYVCWGVTAVVVTISCIVVALLFLRWQSVRQAIRTVNTILAPITYGAILAYLLSPVYNHLQIILRKFLKKDSTAKAGATVGSLIVLVAVVFGLFSMIIPEVWESIVGIVNSIPSYAQVISGWIEDIFSNYPEVEQVILANYNQGVERLVTWLQSETGLMANIEKVLTGLYTGVISLINLVKNILIGMIVMVYLLNIKDTLSAQAKKIVYGLFSIHAANEIVEKVRFVHKVFGGFIIGKLVDSLIIGLITFIWLGIFKMPYTLLISVIIGVTNVIPFFGPFIGAIPSAILLLLVSPRQCIWFLVSILVIQQFDGNILGPKILGNSTGVSSFWVLFSILFFGGIMGPIGMIIGVPTFAVIYRLIAEFVEKRLASKQLSTATKDYGDLDYIDEKKKTYIR
ncbi:MAG: AI-2E family transporter [Hungatella sp.]|nr:AI-2E family transporter [Hungatella sp.]